jgi:hypothetical protein
VLFFCRVDFRAVLEAGFLVVDFEAPVSPLAAIRSRFSLFCVSEIFLRTAGVIAFRCWDSEVVEAFRAVADFFVEYFRAVLFGALDFLAPLGWATARVIPLSCWSVAIALSAAATKSSLRCSKSTPVLI